MKSKAPHPALYTLLPSRLPRRLIFIGDIHGCYEELVELLRIVAPSADDVVISLGDVTRKGPSPVRCLDLWRERRYLAVLGNNELKSLRNSRRGILGQVFLDDADRALNRRKDLLEHFRGWPLVIDCPGEAILAVHGGLLPDQRVEEASIRENRESIVRLRRVKRVDGRWRGVSKGDEDPSFPFWHEVWDGDRFAVYGHIPRDRPRFDRKALGIDTGCVYGGALTAAVYDGRDWSIESVKARRRYA